MDPANHSEIIKVSEDWAKALESNDAQAIGSFMHDDWVIVGRDGYTAKHEFLPLIESGDLTHDNMNLVSEPRIQVYADTAVFTGRIANSGSYKGRSFTADEWTTDVYLRQNGKWLCIVSHITPAA